MNMVERVARALHGDVDPWPRYGCEVCINRARAAIAAMREPTEEMMDACTKHGVIPIFMWQAMIDAALEEK